MFARVAALLLALFILVQPISAAPLSRTAAPGPHPALGACPAASGPAVAGVSAASFVPAVAGVSAASFVPPVAGMPASAFEPGSPADPKAPDSVFRFFSISATAFMPSSSSITWYYPTNADHGQNCPGGKCSGGCIHPTAKGAWRAPLNLLEGSRISSLWFGYYEYSNSSPTTLRLVRYDQRGQMNPPEVEVAHVTTNSGALGFQTVTVSIEPNHYVDNAYYMYEFVWDGPASTTAVQELCSAQVGYYPVPIYGTFVPAMRK